MNTKPIEKVHLENLKALRKSTYELKWSSIDVPSFDNDGEPIIPIVEFRSKVIQALVLTHLYRISGTSDNRIIRSSLMEIRDSDFNIHTQYDQICKFISLLDAIITQIESGIIYFSASELPNVTQGSIDQIIKLSSPGYIEKELRDLISRDIAEFVRAAQLQMYKSAVLLAGSIAEAVLLGVAKLNPEATKNLLPEKKRRDFEDKAGIEDLAKVCRDAKIITDSTLKTEILRDYRDLIHPNRHIKSQTTLRDYTLSTIIGFLYQLLQNLADSEEKGLIQRFKEAPPGAYPRLG